MCSGSAVAGSTPDPTVTELRSLLDGRPVVGDDHRYVFVGGLHRSGTSMVARALADCDGATGLVGTGVMEDEGHYLHDVIPSAFEHGGPGRFAFDPRAHLGPSTAPERDRARLLAAWEPYWEDPEALTRVEKSPQNLLQTIWLQSLLPSARFVIVIRHPAAVALATRKWTRPGPRRIRRLAPPLGLDRLIGHWCHAHHLFEHDRPSLTDVDVVRFEDSAVRRSDPSRSPSYDEQWRQWLDSREGRAARKTWLPMAEAAMARWGYSIDDELV